MQQIVTSRRDAIRTAGLGTLSAGAFAVLAGAPSAAAAALGKTNSGDIETLNVALALEHEGIAAYQIGAESGLLKGDVLQAAVLFQGHHKGHRDELAKVIRTLGGKPVESRPIAEYAQELDVANTIKAPNDVLALAQRLERGATAAYLGIIPGLEDPDMKHLAARLAADESTHFAIITAVLGQAIPAKTFIFE